MLISIALILLVGMFMGWLCKKIKLPGFLEVASLQELSLDHTGSLTVEY